jgi:hypothetical protein
LDNETAKSFEGNLPGWLNSRLPPLRRRRNEYTQELGYPEDDFEKMSVALPVFNGLPKIHKTPWKIHPVVPCHSVIQGPASEFLSKVLKTLLPDYPQILTATKELVHTFEVLAMPKLKSLPRNVWNNKLYLVTADIEGFYTNVPIEKCRSCLCQMLDDKYGHTRSGRVKRDFIIELFDVQQKTLIMKAQIDGQWHFVRQTDGLAMGMSAAPDIANLFAAFYEKRFHPEFYEKCLIFKRYIDDIFLLISAENLEDLDRLLGYYKIPGLKLNWEISETNAVFLDLEVWRNPYSHSQRLKYRPYRKPMNNFERLPWCTGHSLQLLRAAFKSEMHRFAVSSWSTPLYNEELNWLKDLYISRGYPPQTVIAWIAKFKVDAYKNRLSWNPEQDEDARVWPLRSEMNPVWQNLNLSMVSEAMDKYIAGPEIDYRISIDDDFSDRLSFWKKRLVASQKRPFNFGDKENKHNRSLLNISSNDSKFELSTRAAEVLTEDRITGTVQGYLDPWLRQENPEDLIQFRHPNRPFDVGGRR